MPLPKPGTKKNLPQIIFIVGPTGVGKSAVAAVLAKRLKTEIISCDSMQVYKGMRIVSSYPDKKLLAGVKHYLISSIPANREFNVSRYRTLALKKINDLVSSGKIPILAGGTGLYMSVLVDGIFKAKAPDKIIKKRLYLQAENKGSAFLHKRLMKVDVQAGSKIHPNDTKRIIRALEIFESTGKPISQLQNERKGLSSDYDIKIFCLNTDREGLYRRIDARVEAMFEAGLVNEVKRLLSSGLSKTSRTALGIREVKGFLDGDYDLDEAKRILKLNTRHYAKRQLTWFRKDKRIQWINLLAKDKPEMVGYKIWKKLS